MSISTDDVSAVRAGDGIRLTTAPPVVMDDGTVVRADDGAVVLALVGSGATDAPSVWTTTAHHTVHARAAEESCRFPVHEQHAGLSGGSAPRNSGRPSKGRPNPEI